MADEQRERISRKNKNRDWRAFTPESRAYFLDELRQARLAAQKDAEAFDELLFAFERLGGYRLAESAALGDYRESLLDLAAGSALGGLLGPKLAPWHSTADTLYTLVNQGRNDALHRGARARHLTEHTIELALLFEDALMNGSPPAITIGDVMVRSPVIAEDWQPMSFAREKMLTNSFSNLPIWRAGQWKVLTDAGLVAFLRKDSPNRDERGRRIGLSLREAAGAGLQFADAVVRPQMTTLAEVSEQFANTPAIQVVLVCAAGPTDPGLLGIVTAFDIL